MSTLRLNMLVAASLLTLSALLDQFHYFTDDGGLLAGGIANIVRLGAAVCWVGYLIAGVRDEVEELEAGNRDLIIRELRRLERHGVIAPTRDDYPVADKRRAHLKSCE